MEKPSLYRTFSAAAVLVSSACLAIAAQPPAKLQINPGKLIELNKPGSITVTIDIGLDDGIRPGHTLNVVHHESVVGTIQILKAKPDQSTVKITDVSLGKTLSLGDDIQSQ